MGINYIECTIKKWFGSTFLISTFIFVFTIDGFYIVLYYFIVCKQPRVLFKIGSYIYICFKERYINGVILSRLVGITNEIIFSIAMKSNSVEGQVAFVQQWKLEWK